MKLIKSLLAVGCAVAMFTATHALAASCCAKSKAKGEDCKHQCCVDARKAKNLCEKCQANASCCDKAIAKGEACAHKCCVDAAKEKKVCDKCNPEKKS
jgi:hypothetical protein